jgi:hypothetical protein
MNERSEIEALKLRMQAMELTAITPKRLAAWAAGVIAFLELLLHILPYLKGIHP